MVGYVDEIYAHEGIDCRVFASWSLSKLREAGDKVESSAFLNRMIDPYVVELADYGITVRSTGVRFGRDAIRLHFDSPINSEAYAEVIIERHAITIEYCGRYTLDKFKAKNLRYMRRIQQLSQDNHAAKMQLFSVLPQPIAEELAEYVSLVFIEKM